MDIWVIIAAFSIPSAITGLSFWCIQRLIVKNEEKRRKREECLEEHQLILIESISASIALGEATAIAVRDKHCNGEMTKALDYAQKVKHKQKDYLNKQAVKQII